MKSSRVYMFFVLIGLPTIYLVYSLSQPQVLGTTKISYSCLPDQTAFELLKSYQPKVEFKESALGKMVTSINGVTQDNGKYWMYNIDGKEATVSADSYLCQGSETISWELR